MRRSVASVVLLAAAVAALTFSGHVAAQDAASQPASGPTNAPANGPAKKFGSITGTVRDSEGKPVANALVRVVPPRREPKPPAIKAPSAGSSGRGMRPPGTDKPVDQEKPTEASEELPPPPATMPTSRPTSRPAALTGKTDAEGKFVIENVPVGEHGITVVNRGATAYEKITVTEDVAVNVDLQLKKPEAAPPRPPRQPSNNGGGSGRGGGRRGM